ncbi:hypothetical protein GCM10010974_35620 [Brevibacterium sediminis]|uniref:Uncharacterized protein n=1 Tax=Brevibacterium sediminis TaxID=1857024 RepID=A0ABQ1N060_9MICO|nr:hypothetical protein GCM10010974_35620 [Brevibacterium sediminis]
MFNSEHRKHIEPETVLGPPIHLKSTPVGERTERIDERPYPAVRRCVDTGSHGIGRLHSE